ncbi:hypothetical protein BBK82_30110 [Lentzea guizhouensis]|uniref:Uncharacterized protein n=1 Tax=Lentzea guizhouensis TaxID=1586287 RepID=A0A1B2HPJ9_9PSEU|nr:hypothetical protein [Lentzea guizhouensis]ANZ39667.1 hypothetical protein BBK82_30110 [Lentzea guizhouensis]
MSTCTERVVQLRTPMSDDQRLSLAEQAALCHPAVRGAECWMRSGGEVVVEVVVWRGSSAERVRRDLGAALDAVLGGAPVHVDVTAVAYRRRATVLLSVCA